MLGVCEDVGIIVGAELGDDEVTGEIVGEGMGKEGLRVETVFISG